MGLSAADLLSVQTGANDFLPNTVTNTRTKVELPCRVSFETAQIARLEGVPYWMHTPKWRLTLPVLQNGVAVDVQTGDRMVEPVKGTYALIEVESPDSYPVVINTWGALLHPTGGTIILPNEPALSFRTTRNGVTTVMTVAGRVQPLSLSAKAEILGQDSASQLYEVVWDSSFAYPTVGGVPHAGDMIHVPAIAADWLPFHEPDLFLDVLPYSSALVEVTA